MLIKRALPYLCLFFLIETILRLTLLVRAAWSADFLFSEYAGVMLRGAWFDCITASFLMLPLALYHFLLPARRQDTRLDRMLDQAMRFAFCYVLLFDALSEHIFWTEFNTRFNFIAVDYLVYTQEVIGNIMESYPVYWLLLLVMVMALLMTWLSLRLQPLRLNRPVLFRQRLISAAYAGLACAALYGAGSIEQSYFRRNTLASEAAANGIYNLFYAFWHNEIDYDRFYATEDESTADQAVRALLTEKNSRFVSPNASDLTRQVSASGPERHKNVMLITMESMSADYMGIFGNKENLTPNLDRLAGQGLFFTDAYATGTRTVRGLEALTLSIPPTPGQSILRRPDNENLFSLGFIFKDRGYDTRFIYGGYGYFDNMNAFFSANGFSVLDRNAMDASEIQFANVWGICDEDMFARAVREADASYAAGRPFMHLVMTTSNHRPFTYPDGRIDVPSHSNRLGGVKYADYSIGKLIEWASAKPWFKDTVFIFVADHTAGAGGKSELDPVRYHIPIIFYAPGFIAPQRYEHLMSQIDVGPTLLGMLNFNYYTKFYGEDLLSDVDEVPHTFISNYQKVALVKNKQLTILAPKRKVEQFSWPEESLEKVRDTSLISNAIAYYQTASLWKERYRRIPTEIGIQ